MKLTGKQLNSIKSYFNDKPVKRAFIFGSYARDEADEKSDIDILVELDYSKRVGLLFFAMQNELEKITNTKVDLVTPSSLSRHIRPFVENEKVLIYEE